MKLTPIAFLLAACTTVAIAGSPTRAVAQAPAVPAPDKAASDRADELVKRGSALGKKERYAEAEVLLREAWSLKHSYDIAGNLGILEAALGKHRDAAEHLSFAMKTFPANGKPEHRKLLEQTFAKVAREVAAVTIEVDADGAEVLVDGTSVGVSPLGDAALFVAPGHHTIEAKRGTDEGAKETFDVAKGGSRKVSLRLRSTSAGPAGTASAIATGAPPPPPPSGGPAIGVLIAGGALAGAALVGGTVFAVVSNGKAGDADAARATLATKKGAACGPEEGGTCLALRDAVGSQATFANAALWSFVGAGAVGAATLIYAIAAPKRVAGAGVRVVPMVTAGERGVVVVGAW